MRTARYAAELARRGRFIAAAVSHAHAAVSPWHGDATKALLGIAEDVAVALVVLDMVGVGGLEEPHVDRLLAPWADVVGDPRPLGHSPPPARPLGKLIKHGTIGGYRAHFRLGIEPCAMCREANNAYARGYQRRRKEAEKALVRKKMPPYAGPCGTYLAYKAHLRRREEPCLECREANRLHNEQTRQRLLASPRKDVELACGTPKGVYRHRARGVRDRCGVSPKKAGTR